MLCARVGVIGLSLFCIIAGSQHAFTQDVKADLPQPPSIQDASKQGESKKGVADATSLFDIPVLDLSKPQKEGPAFEYCKIKKLLVIDTVPKKQDATGKVSASGLEVATTESQEIQNAVKSANTSTDKVVAIYMIYYAWNSNAQRKIAVTVALKANADFRKGLARTLKLDLSDAPNRLPNNTLLEGIAPFVQRSGQAEGTLGVTDSNTGGNNSDQKDANVPDLKQADIVIHLAPGEWQPIGVESVDIQPPDPATQTGSACAPASKTPTLAPMPDSRQPTVKTHDKYKVVGAAYESSKSDGGDAATPPKP